MNSRLTTDNLLMERLSSRALGAVLSRITFLIFAIWIGWELPQIFKFCFLFAYSFPQFISLLFHFTISSKQKPGHHLLHFAWPCPQLNIQVLLFTQYQDPIQSGSLPLITRITFPPVSNGMFLTSVWALTRSTVNAHISTNSPFKAI